MTGGASGIDLVAFDLDGTLAESKSPVSPAMGEQLARLLEILPAAIMSGASFAQFKTQFLPALPLTARRERLYIFPDNAAQCFIYADGAWKSLYDYSFTVQEKERITLAVYEALDEAGLREAPVRVWGERIEDRGAQISFSPLGQHAPLPEKKRWHDAHDKVRMRLRETLAGYLPEFSVAAGGATTVDITRKGFTKAYGMRYLSDALSIPLSRMLYVGDALYEGGNDAVVKETGVSVRQVAGPEETADLIADILA